MHAFHLERKMMSMLGDFYPTGNLFIMLPSEEHARRAESLLVHDGYDCNDVSFMTPQDVLEVAHMFDNRDLALPSVGTEEDTCRHFAELAREGHHALLVPVKNHAAVERVMKVLGDVGISRAVHYRHFVIEDLVV
ncbi:RNA-binding protein [Ramlibacter henchirensis]|uniref:RNA-binding protein n=1 Tax=Ramlibacter henchirensis TaxID=204072 RepID=A0A4Z0CAN2_9BURK|nr:RNA-binding protein [Ramlibacter henchirensis]TFZ07185.1 RNA-binding protein [Ramlibacter henchirensis]